MSNNAKNTNKSTYKVDVIKANKTFKDAVRSTGKGLRVLKAALQDEPSAKPMLKQIEKILKDQKLYKALDKGVRRITTGENKGKTCPFYILQAVYRMKEGKKVASSTNKSKTAKATVTTPKTAPNNAKSLQKQTVVELRKVAKDLSIDVPTKAKKADIIELIKKAA